MAGTQYASTVGTSIAYDTIGDGPDIVFLHAGIAHRSMWKPQIDALANDFRCTTMDLRGFGDSPTGTETYSRRDDIAAVLDAVGAESAVIVGCSIGGSIALDFAIERPHRVRALVLSGISPSGSTSPDDQALVSATQEIDAALERDDVDRAAWLEVELWVDGPRRPPGSAPEWLRNRVYEWCLPTTTVSDWGDSIQLDPPAAGRLREVVAPALVVIGLEDVEVVIEGSTTVAAGVEHAILVQFEDTAHLPNLEKAAGFTEAMVEFLDAVAPEG